LCQVHAMIDEAASFKSIFDNLQQCEEEEQAGRAEQQGAGDLLSYAEGSVASAAVAEVAMPIADLFRFEEGAQLRRS
jgi:hypothetical protein